jgi:hypothetical protein
LGAREAALAAAEQAIADNRAEERTLNRKLTDYQSYRKSAIRSLDSGLGDANTAQRQLDTAIERIDETETRLLEILEERDDLEVARDATVGERDASAGQLAEVQAATEQKVAEMNARIATHNELRRGHFTELFPEDQHRYKGLMRGKGSAIAWIDRGSCVKCRIAVPSHRLTLLKRGQPLICDGCARWILHPPRPE